MAAMMFVLKGHPEVSPIFLAWAVIAGYANYKIGSAKGEKK